MYRDCMYAHVYNFLTTLTTFRRFHRIMFAANAQINTYATPETPLGTPTKASTPITCQDEITITLLADPSTVYASALSAWKSLFGAKASKPHPDYAAFKETYSHPNGRLLVASTPKKEIAGIIAYRNYDGRFKQPELAFDEALKVVEVVRLFVEPELRGQGIATSLIKALIATAREDGVEIMYLHTHPFLPGAQYLWQKEGWRVVVREEDEPWFTIHMRRDL
jgi:GNAT superfamily N-acetyltransferase